MIYGLILMVCQHVYGCFMPKSSRTTFFIRSCLYFLCCIFKSFFLTRHYQISPYFRVNQGLIAMRWYTSFAISPELLYPEQSYLSAGDYRTLHSYKLFWAVYHCSHKDGGRSMFSLRKPLARRTT